jgi:hypothetical protein
MVLLPLAGCKSLFEDATTVDVDYDVDFVEPVVFDGSNALPPRTIAVSLSSANPTTTVAVGDADEWGPLLHANAMAEDAGEERIFSIRASGTPTFTGAGPVAFTVEVSSADGDVWGDDLGAEPTDVPACSFELDPATAQPDDLGIHLEDCLVDWTRENGAPSELALTIDAAPVAQAIAAGGEPFDYSGSAEMETNQQVEVGCERAVALPNDVIDRLDNIEFDAIALHAIGTANDPVAVAWFGFVFDSDGRRVASGAGFEALAGGDSREFHAEVASAGDSATISGDATVLLSPTDAADFLDATIRALSGADTGGPGGGVACWFSIGAAPRSGTLEVSIEGIAKAGL